MLAALFALASACGGASAEPSTPADPCAGRFETEPFRALLADLEVAGSVEPVWPGYPVARQDLVLESLDTDGDGACVAHWSGSAIRTVARSDARITNSLGFFGFLITERADADPAQRMGFLAGGVPPAILRSLRASGTEAALVWTGDRGTLDEAGFPAAAERRRLARYFVLHEGAHVHQLLGPVFASSWPAPRPGWRIQADEEALLDRCLADPSAARERGALADATAAVEAGDLSGARSRLAAFARLRAERYERLREVRVPSSSGGPLPCWVAEDVWELDEGGADFISLVTLSEAGLDFPWSGSLADYVRDDANNEPYYHTGLGQLFTLRALASDPEAALLRVGGAASPQGSLWCEVARLVEVPFPPCLR